MNAFDHPASAANGARPRKRSVAGLAAAVLQDARRRLASAAIAGAADVLGVPHEDAVDNNGHAPALVVVRSAAALALVDRGWTHSLAASMCKANNHVTEDGSKENARARRHLGNVIAAATRAVDAALVADPSLAVTRTRRSPAEVVADLRRHSADVSPHGVDIFSDSHSDKDKRIARLRAEVVKRMVMAGHAPTAVSKASGWTTSAVYNWLCGIRGRP